MPMLSRARKVSKINTPNNDNPGKGRALSSRCPLTARSHASCTAVAVTFQDNIGGLHVVHRVHVEDCVAILCLGHTCMQNQIAQQDRRAHYRQEQHRPFALRGLQSRMPSNSLRKVSVRCDKSQPRLSGRFSRSDYNPKPYLIRSMKLISWVIGIVSWRAVSATIKQRRAHDNAHTMVLAFSNFQRQQYPANNSARASCSCAFCRIRRCASKHLRKESSSTAPALHGAFRMPSSSFQPCPSRARAAG